MLKIGQPPTQPQPPPSDGPPPELLAALAGGGQPAPGKPPLDPTAQPDEPSPDKFDAQKVDPVVARYLPPGSTCSGCEYFNQDGSCELVRGQIDPGGICFLFTPSDAGTKDQPNDSEPPTDDVAPPEEPNAQGPAPIK